MLKAVYVRICVPASAAPVLEGLEVKCIYWNINCTQILDSIFYKKKLIATVVTVLY